MSVKGTVINRAYDKPAPTIHPKLTEHSRKMKKKVYKISENYLWAVSQIISAIFPEVKRQKVMQTSRKYIR